MKIREKFNETTRNVGNRMKEGLGDLLTKEIKLSKPLTVVGSIGGMMVLAEGITHQMYKEGIVNMMYSEKLC